MPVGAAPFPLKDIHVTETTRGVRVEVPFRTGEVIYGLGLQCRNLIQNGSRKTLFTTASDSLKGGSHAPFPFMRAPGGMGCLLTVPVRDLFGRRRTAYFQRGAGLSESSLKRAVQTDVQQRYAAEKSTDGASIYVDVPSAHGVDIYLFAGPRMGDAIARYNLFSGGDGNVDRPNHGQPPRYWIAGKAEPPGLLQKLPGGGIAGQLGKMP